MTDPISELKTRARLLQHRLQAGDPTAIPRLRALPALRRAPATDLAATARTARLHQCLTVIARELGFADWAAASAVIGGEWPAEDFGTLLCPRRAGGHLNHWFRSHAEAAACRDLVGGYLLTYRRHFVVVDRYYIAALGLDPDAPEWRQMGHDWYQPTDVDARTRLYGELVAALPRELV